MPCSTRILCQFREFLFLHLPWLTIRFPSSLTGGYFNKIQSFFKLNYASSNFLLSDHRKWRIIFLYAKILIKNIFLKKKFAHKYQNTLSIVCLYFPNSIENPLKFHFRDIIKFPKIKIYYFLLCSSMDWKLSLCYRMMDLYFSNKLFVSRRWNIWNVTAVDVFSIGWKLVLFQVQDKFSCGSSFWSYWATRRMQRASRGREPMENSSSQTQTK